MELKKFTTVRSDTYVLCHETEGRIFVVEVPTGEALKDNIAEALKGKKDGTVKMSYFEFEKSFDVDEFKTFLDDENDNMRFDTVKSHIKKQCDIEWKPVNLTDA